MFYIHFRSLKFLPIKGGVTFFLSFFAAQVSFAQGVAINATGTAPDSSSILDVGSTTQGFLPPRMSTAQRDAIVSPALGLIIYNITANCLQWWNGSSWHDGCGNNPPVYPAGTVHCGGISTAITDITSPATAKTWMDRNLGAAQVAVSSTDINAHGDLYQWGRRADGHQCRTSSTTSSLSSSDQPSHGDFILSTAPNDWRNPQNDNLWQGINGINNPCPSGYRLPTEAEINAERSNFSSNNAAGAFASPLKLPASGYRNNSNGTFSDVGNLGYYWTSSISSTNSRSLFFSSSNSTVNNNNRAFGFSVRCIKN